MFGQCRGGNDFDGTTMRAVKSAAVFAIMMVLCATASAAITVEQLQTQATLTEGALLQYSVAKDEQVALVPQADAAWVRWQQLTTLATLYYGCGEYIRGDYYQLAATREQAEYDRLITAIRLKATDVESKWQTYRREFERLQAMLAAYRSRQ